MSVPGSTEDSSYGESSQLVCICSSGNEHSCPLHRQQRQHQQSHPPHHRASSTNTHTYSLQGSEMQAFHRQPSQPHHLADQRFAGMAQAQASAHSYLPSPIAGGLPHPSSQPFPVMSSTDPSGMMAFQQTSSNPVQASPYTISPDAVWTGLSAPQLMPAISMPMAQQVVHQSPVIHDSMGWFPPPTGTSLPSEALQASGSSHSLNSIHHTPGGPSSVQLPGMIQPDPLSWGSFRPSTAGQVPGPAFSDSPAYSIQSQTASSGPAQYHLPGLSWIQPTFERSDSLKAETLPPNSPGLGELVPTPHRHVSAPTTPVTAFDPSRSLAISDFQQGFSQLHNPHRTLYLSTTPQNDQLHSPGVPSVSPFVGPSSRPSTSPRLILDNSPVPFLNRTFSTDDAKYEAVLARSHAADRAFVCAATTTRIYCRPSCASKRPDRSRLRFFSNPNAAEQAEAAGFRPCKRCKPQTPGTADQCVLAVGDCARHMVMSARNPTAGAGGDDDDDGIQRGTLKEYSARANLSAFHFHRTFKAVTSVTLGELGKALNTLALQDALGEWTPQVPQTSYPGASQLSSTRASPPPPEEIAHLLVGWSARRARRALGGLVPSVYAAGCPDAPVRYVCAESAFGPVAVAFLDAVPLDGTMSGMPSAGQPSSSPMPVAADEGGFPLHSTGGYLSAPHGTNLGMLPLSPPSNCIFLTCVLGPNAAATIQRRFPSAVPQPQYTGWIVSIVEELHRTGSREVQLPPEVVGAIRRARVWIELQHLSTPKRASSDLGTAPEASVSSTSLDNL